ncbi:MAG: SBBP repeat-containing protein, partial [Actinobacteria bacterium]|nr:SBBP repeat-containing protein [Actinomycetota bacterium]
MITSYFFKNSFVHKNFAFLVAVLLGLSFLIFSNSTKLSNLTNSVSPLSSKTTIEAEKEKAIKAYGKLPIYFVPNKGQLNSKVKYYAAGAGYSFYLTQDGVTYSFTKNNPNDAKNLLTPETNKDIDKSKKIEGYALKIKFLGTNQNTILESQKEQKGKVNYLIGNDSKKWQTNLSIFSQITYKNLYSGIDLTYKSDQKKIKYEFTVSPKANYKEVKFLYKGANSLRLDKKGNLLINTPWGKLKDEKPYVYQLVNGEKVSVDAGFTIKDDAVGFSLGNYNPNLPLVIDPGLLYSTFLGGSDIDYGFGIALDVLGNAYVIGNTQSSNFPTTVGAFDATHDYGCNIFVTKLNPQGSDLLYSTFLGGSDIDYGFGITLDASDNAYVTGYTSSSNFPTTAGAFDATHNGGYDDAFVAKLNPQGSGLLYSTFLGGSSGDYGWDITLDASDNAYVTGYTSSSNFPTTAGAFDATHNGGYDDAFVA